MNNTVPEWSYTLLRIGLGYTVELIQAQKDTTKQRAAIPLLDLSWTEADLIGKVIVEILKDKTVMLDTEEIKKSRVRDAKRAIQEHERDIAKYQEIIKANTT